MQSHKQYIEYLIETCELDKSKVYSRVKNPDKLDIIDLQNIANNMNLHITHMVNQTVDTDYLNAVHNRGNILLPRSFKKGAFSSTTSLNSVMQEFIEYEKYEDALIYLQINPEILKNHEKISITVIHDLIQFMQRYIDDEKLANIGKRNADAFLKTDFFGDVFYDCLNNKRPGESLFENIDLIERNWTYDIEKSGNGKMIINTSQTEEMLDNCPSSNYTDNNTVTVRFEFIKRVLEKVGYHSQIRQLTDIKVDGEFNFEIEFSKIRKPPLNHDVFVFQ